MKIYSYKTLPKDIGMKFPRKVRLRPANKKVSMPEKDIQAAVENYLYSKGIDKFVRIPDVLNRYIFARPDVPLWIKRWIKLYIKGMPDLIIPHPTKRHGKYMIALPLELKTEAGKLSHAQAVWGRVWGTIITHGMEEAIKEINDFLGA